MGQMGKKVKTTVFVDDIMEVLEGMFTDRTMTVPGVRTEIYSNVNLEGSPVDV